VLNSNGQEKSKNICECRVGYKWEGKACVEDVVNFGVKCDTVSHSAGQLNFTTCSCKQGFVWTNKLCFRNCKIVPNSNKELVSP
jgi:hypothetical protein